MSKFMNQYLGDLYKVLRSLRTENGLYRASTGNFYSQFCWIRDCFYESLPELKKNPKMFKQTYRSLLDYFKMIEEKYNKFTSIVECPNPKFAYRYLHARIDANTNDEVHEPWSNKQNDTIGEMFFGIALGIKNGISIIEDESDIVIINKMISYIEALEYWTDFDSGYWEEGEELRSSSIGIVVAGLKALKSLDIGIIIKDELIQKGIDSLNKLLPAETPTRACDLAQLSLIYPFNSVTPEQKEMILTNVEQNLLRTNGVIRYKKDWYYNRANQVSADWHKHWDIYVDDKNQEGWEAEWVFGFAYLGLIYAEMGQPDVAKEYLKKIIKRSPSGNVPELFYAKTYRTNENNPLGWSVALTILLTEKLIKMGMNIKLEDI